MTPKQLTKLSVGLLASPRLTWQALFADENRSAPTWTASMRAAADWLLLAQSHAPDGDGYSRRFSLLRGWDRGYIETTGYIIPTLLDVSRHLAEPRYFESARRAGEWLLTVQTEAGAFTDIDTYQPQVFDTGQVLLGLNRWYRETKDPRYEQALVRAGNWLCAVQEEDGSWQKFAYSARPHAYYTRVAAALIEAGLLVDSRQFVEAGERNLSWALRQRQPNGYFRYSEFREGEDAILHTIVYVLEGFAMAHRLRGNEQWNQALVEGTRTLAGLLNRDGLLHSQYDPQWRVTNGEYCVTGLAQYAGVCFETARLTGESDFIRHGTRIMEKLRRWQHAAPGSLVGALSGSRPLWGYYGGMEYLNWNVKFYLDALLGLLSSTPGEPNSRRT